MILTRSHKRVLESVAGPHHCLVWERRAEIFIFPHPQVIGSGQLPGESNCSSNSHTPYLSSASLREALWKRDTSASYWEWKHTKSLWTWNGKDVQGAEQWHHLLQTRSELSYILHQGIKIFKDKLNSSKGNITRDNINVIKNQYNNVIHGEKFLRTIFIRSILIIFIYTCTLSVLSNTRSGMWGK